MDGIKTGMDDIDELFDRLDGNLYEERAARTAVQLAGVELGIQGPRLAFSHFVAAHPDFNPRLLAAARSGLISQEDFRDLIRADLIIHGQNQQHAVVEISLGPNGDDISRALRRSQILQRATGEHVAAVVTTPNPHPEFIQEAEARNVQVLDIPV